MKMKGKKIQTIEEMKRAYPDEWLLIEYEKLGPNLSLDQGKLIAHSPRKEDIYLKQLNLPKKKLAIEYSSDVPEDYIVIFTVPR